MMSDLSPTSFAPHDLAASGLLPCVSQVTILSGRPLTPPLALIFATSTLAAASAGWSNGAMLPVLSSAQPITIGSPAADAGGTPAPVAPQIAARARATPSAPLFRTFTSLSFVRERGTSDRWSQAYD